MYFICTALTKGASEINQIEGEFPFENMTSEQFKAMRYRELDVTKQKDAQFISGGKKFVDSYSFNELFVNYLTHLLNNAVGDTEEINENSRLEVADLEESNLRDMSFGDFLSNCVDSVLNIFDHKVLLINTF